jgi:hypothetical protein
MKLLVTWNAYSEFEIPDGTFLLSILDNATAKYGEPGSWVIRWNTLHYMDKNCKLHIIKGNQIDVDYKNPEEIEEVNSK